MIPNVFVSSTIMDLQHLRDALRETITELGYNPVMSDYGDIGYLPSATAEDSCYITMRDCQLGVLIIGKRYGTKSGNGLGVTHNEFRTAREQNIPVITLVDRNVMSYRSVYDANASKGVEPEFPGMDSPKDTFCFIKEIAESPLNNGILPFDTASDARLHFKKQLAHLFGDLLRNRFDPIKIQLTDVLSEIKTVRHEILKDKGAVSIRYLKATRFILEEKLDRFVYRELAKKLCGSLDDAVPLMIASHTFDDFMKSIGATLEILDEDRYKKIMDGSKKFLAATIFDASPSNLSTEKKQTGKYGIFEGKRLIMNDIAKMYFDQIHAEFVKEIT